MASLWAEIKRRNVVRVAVAYAVVAWVMIEISSTTFPMLKLPEWAATLVTVLLMIGFPVAVIFAWAFELTPEGLKKEKDVDRSESITHLTGRKLDFAIIGVLAVAVVYFVSEKLFWTDDVVTESQVEISSAATEEISRSIAVLPFVNMSGDADQEYFSDGITEEILNALAGIPELAVTSRTSAFAFKGKSVSIPKIAEELGVAHILEGSVRRSGNQLRITAQLIEVASDRHLWSESYDRELTDIFAVQDEISENIVAALKMNLLGDTVARSASSAVIPEAYDLYLRGLQQMAINTFDSVAQATDYFEQSLVIDPLFVRAYAGLGWAFADQVYLGSGSIDDNLAKIRQVTRHGLDLDPDNAGLIGLAGQVAYWDGDMEQAELRFRRALGQEPPHYDVRNFYINLLGRQSRIAEAEDLQKEWLESDPLNPQANVQIAFSHLHHRRFDDAFATTSRLKIIAPDNPYGQFIDGLGRIYYLGDLATGILALESGLKIDPNDHEVISILAISYYSIGEVVLADALVEKGRQIAPDATFVQAAYAYGLALRGDLQAAKEVSLDALTNHRQFDRWWGGYLILRLAVDELIDRGEPMQAVDMIVEAEPEWAAFRIRSPIEAPQLSATSGSYGTESSILNYLPDFARALRAAGDESGTENVLAHMEATQDWRSEHGLLNRDTRTAEIHALRGRWVEAQDALERAEENGTIYAFWQYRLIHNRIFDDIRDQPRFKALVQRVQAEMQRQRIQLNNNRLPNDLTSED